MVDKKENKNELKKKKIIDLLNNTQDLQTTNHIKESLGIHNYKAELLLYQLLREGKVEMQKIGESSTAWRIRK